MVRPCYKKTHGPTRAGGLPCGDESYVYLGSHPIYIVSSSEPVDASPVVTFRPGQPVILFPQSVELSQKTSRLRYAIVAKLCSKQRVKQSCIRNYGRFDSFPRNPLIARLYVDGKSSGLSNSLFKSRNEVYMVFST